jgi:RNA polymerase sigma-70 factor (ECF subfamily)
MDESSDQQLIRDYLKGDDLALEILVQRYLKLIYSFIFRLVKNEQTAEDLTQEVFVKIWKNLRKFKKNRNFKAWALTIAKNSAIDFLRKKKTASFSEFDVAEGENLILEILADSAPLPDAVLESKNLMQKAESAVNKLSSKSKEVMVLHYNQGLTFEEISQLLGESLNTVKSRHHRALIGLRRVFGY